MAGAISRIKGVVPFLCVENKMLRKLFYVIQQFAYGSLAFILILLPVISIYSIILILFGPSTDSLVNIIVAAISFAISIPIYSFLKRTFVGRFVQYLVNHLDVG